jgi:hypothetical protein
MKTQIEISKEEIINKIKGALLIKKRIAFWGIDQEIINALYSEGILEPLDFIIVSDKKEHIGLKILNLEVCSIYRLQEFKPDEIIVFDEKNAISVYESLIRDFGYSPLQVFISNMYWKTTHYVSDSIYKQCIDSIPKETKGGLSAEEVVIHLYDSLKYVIRNNIPGNIINLGVYQGWSMYFIALVLEYFGEQKRKIIGFDTFGGFSPVSVKNDVFCDYQCSLGKTGYNFFKDTGYENVARLLKPFSNVSLIKGDINDEISRIKDEPVALALFDMDDYTPTKVALEPIYKCLSPRGVMIHDHYSYHTLCEGSCVGQRIAVLEFLENHWMFNLTGTNVFMKI